MKIEFTVPFRRLPAQTDLIEPSSDPQVRPARIARLVALAHKLDALVRSGAVSSYGELARLGHVSPARLTQIMTLLYLAPSIQEYLLFRSAADARIVSELELRRIAREPHWDRQRAMWEQFFQPCR
jgi:hypothetical protein